MEYPRCLISALDTMLDDPDSVTAVEIAGESYTGELDHDDSGSTALFECTETDCLVNCRVYTWFDEETLSSGSRLTATDGPCIAYVEITLPKIVETQFIDQDQDI